MRRQALSLAALLLLLAGGCGDDEKRPRVSNPQPLTCGDERQAPPQSTSGIVNGSSDWDATVVGLSEGQALAVGAVMTADGGSWTNICTGTLVAEDVVLTAAHCVVDWFGASLQPSELRFGFGADVAAADAVLEVVEVERHAGYDPWGSSAEHDVAVMVLAESAVDRLPGIRPLPFNCTPLDQLGFFGDRVQNVGYGCTDSDCRAENTIRWWTVETVVDVTDYDFTVDGKGVAGVCFGDSGGPTLWTLPSGEIRVMGTLSWGDPDCGNQDHFANTANECSFLEPFLPGCGDVDAVGTCDGDTAVYCDGSLVVTVDCTLAGHTCGAGPDGLVRCLDPCAGETLVGRCDGQDAVWCEGGEVRVRRCADCDQQCGWEATLGGYYCVSP